MAVTITRKKPHVVYSNMSPREEFRINGCLSLATQESLIDQLEDIGVFNDENESYLISAYEPYIQEAAAGFMDEDFLDPIRDSLAEIRKLVKGKVSQELLDDLIETVENLNNEYNQSLEHGMEHIGKLKTAVKECNTVQETYR